MTQLLYTPSRTILISLRPFVHYIYSETILELVRPLPRLGVSTVAYHAFQNSRQRSSVPLAVKLQSEQNLQP